MPSFMRIWPLLVFSLAGLPAQATPLSPVEQANLAISIQQHCQTELVKTPQFMQASAKYGRDFSGPYCNCLASRTAGSMTKEEIVHAARPGSPGHTALQQSVRRYAQECLKAQGVSSGM